MKLIAVISLLSPMFLCGGFAADTLVKTPTGYVKISQLSVNDAVYGINRNGEISVTPVTNTVFGKFHQYMFINIEDEQIVVARGQRFFLPFKYVWCKAKKLHEKDVVLNAFYKALSVQKLQTIKSSITFYEIRLRDDHAFLITERDIIVHNCPLFAVGLWVTWGCGTIAVEYFWASICVAGLWIGTKFCGSSKRPNLYVGPPKTNCNYANQVDNQFEILKESDEPIVIPGYNQFSFREVNGSCNYPPSQHEPNKSCGAQDCKPPRFGPNGCHIPSPKHGPFPKGNIAAGLDMEEGQKALDVSVPVKGKKQRVAVWKGQYIVFEPTMKDVWHNHIRPWKTDKNGLGGLSPEMRQALLNADTVKG